MKDKIFLIKNKLDISEPMHCQRKRCKEELNGLNRHYIDMGEGFVFEMWLCNKCTQKFKDIKGGLLKK